MYGDMEGQHIVSTACGSLDSVPILAMYCLALSTMYKDLDHAEESDWLSK